MRAAGPLALALLDKTMASIYDKGLRPGRLEACGQAAGFGGSSCGKPLARAAGRRGDAWCAPCDSFIMEGGHMAEINDQPVLDDGNDPADRWPHRLTGMAERFSLLAYLLVATVVLLYLFGALWPTNLKDLGQEPGLGWPFAAAGSKLEVGPELRVVLLVLCGGALGGLVHALRSFAAFTGNRQLAAEWLYWYLTRPFTGAIVALVLYLMIRGGLVTGPIQGETSISVVGFTGAAALAGLFSDQAMEKLKEVFGTLFSTQGPDQRGGRLKLPGENPRPELIAIDPSSLPANTDQRQLKLTGRNFVAASTATVDGNKRTARYQPDGSLILVLDPADVAGAGTHKIVVVNPLPGGGSSEPKEFSVT
jgi:hypothetical protein